MRWRLLITLAVAVLAVTAGCIGSEDALSGSDANETVEPTAKAGEGNGTASGQAPPSMTVHSLNTTFTAEAANSGADLEAERVLDVAVPADAQGLVAELRWSGTADLDLHIASPQMCTDTASPVFGPFICELGYVAAGYGDGVHRAGRMSVDVQDPAHRIELGSETIAEQSCGEATCTWHVRAHPNAAVQTDAQLRVTVFNTVEIPDGYSAFEDEAI